MNGNQSTFDCGAFLPGRGPYNFPDFNPGGGVGGPNGNGGPQVEPPGGPRPRPGGDIITCECRIRTANNVIVEQVECPGENKRIGRTCYRVRFIQECIEIVNGQPTIADNQAIIDSMLPQGNNVTVTSWPGAPGGEECSVPGLPDPCSGSCPELVGTWYVDDEGGSGSGPSTPGPFDPGGPSYKVKMCKITGITGPTNPGGTGGQQRRRWTLTQTCVDTFSPAEGLAVLAHNRAKIEEAKALAVAFSPTLAYRITVTGEAGKVCGSAPCEEITVDLAWTPFTGVGNQEPTSPEPFGPDPGPPGNIDPQDPINPIPGDTGPSVPPGTVGRTKDCRCVILGPPLTVPTATITKPSGVIETYYKATFSQDCINVKNITVPSNRDTIQLFVASVVAQGGTFTSAPPAERYGGICKNPSTEMCTGNCAEIDLFYYIVSEGNGPIGTSVSVPGGSVPGVLVEDPDPPGGPRGVRVDVPGGNVPPGTVGSDPDPPGGPRGVRVDVPGGNVPPGTVGSDPDPPGGPRGVRVDVPGGNFLPGTVGSDPDPDPPKLFPKGPTSLGPGVIVPDRVGEGGVNRGRVQIDLKNPNLMSRLLSKNPHGLQDTEIAVDFSRVRTILVNNGYRGPSDIWADKIDSSVDYFLRNRSGNWDFSLANSLTANNIRRSMKYESIKVLDSIKTYSGLPLTDSQIMYLIGTRLIRGDVNEITHSFLLGLQSVTKNNDDITIKTSNNQQVNELAVQQLLEAYSFPMKTEADAWSVEKFKNYSPLATDVDRHVDIKLPGENESRKIYIEDSNKIITNVDEIKVQDGKFFDLTVNSSSVRIPTPGLEDQAHLVPERIRQKAVRALGGDPLRTLEVSAAWSDGIEYQHDIQNKRQPYYFLSANLDTVDTKPIHGSSRMLYETEMRYDFVLVKSQDDIDEINEYIKHKIDNLIYILNDSDLIFDYLESGNNLRLSQQDVVTRVAKGNKSKPIFTRQIPSYILLVPSTRAELLVFDETSHLINLDDDIATRQLKVDVNISKQFANDYNNQFIKNSTVGKYGLDVSGDRDTQARISFLEKDDTLYGETHKDYSQGRMRLTSSQEAEIYRTKTGIRIFKEIVEELDNNYGLVLDGLGKSVTEFDVFSRFTARQWALLMRTENWEELKRRIYTGIVNNVSVTPSLDAYDPQVAVRKTHLILRKANADEDIYKPIKTTDSGFVINPPSNTEPAKLTRQEEKQPDKFTQDFHHIIP